MQSPRHLQPRPAAPPASTPEQKRFHQLVAKIDKARARLSAWRDNVPLFAQLHAQRLKPVLAELAAARRERVFALDALLDKRTFSAADRQTLQQTICDEAGALIDSDDSDDGSDQEALKALYNKHADVDFDTEERQHLQQMQGLFEQMSGVDLGDGVASHEELVQRARERLDAAAQSAEQARPARRKSAPSPAQAKREAEAKLATQSVREVYRKLASNLHPDRAADEADRAAKTALMQRLNQAYEANDLLTLLELQLQIEQVDGQALGSVAPERVKHYNKVLAEQLREIEAEIDAREMQFDIDYGLMQERRLDPNKLAPLIDDELTELRFAMSQLQRERRALDDPAAFKRWLKQERRAQREDDLFDDMF